MDDQTIIDEIAKRVMERIEALEAENARLRASLVAHHDIATLSDDVLREYDYRECPVCRRARASRAVD